MCCFMFAEDGVEHPLQCLQLLSVVLRSIVNNGLVINRDGFTSDNQKIKLKILISYVEDYFSLIYFGLMMTENSFQCVFLLFPVEVIMTQNKMNVFFMLEVLLQHCLMWTPFRRCRTVDSRGHSEMRGEFYYVGALFHVHMVICNRLCTLLPSMLRVHCSIRTSMIS